MTRSLVAQVCLVMLPLIVGSTYGPARAAESPNNGMIRGFQYTDCRKGQCLIVSAPQAWLSNASGGFIAETAGKGSSQREFVQVEVVRSGKSVLKKTADEAVLRPEIDLLTFENEREVVLIELSTLDVQVVKK